MKPDKPPIVAPGIDTLMLGEPVYQLTAIEVQLRTTLSQAAIKKMAKQIEESFNKTILDDLMNGVKKNPEWRPKNPNDKTSTVKIMRQPTFSKL